jgi:hypothetical protein
MRSIAEQQAREPYVLATTFLFLTFLPLLVSLFLAASHLYSFAAGTGTSQSQALGFAPVLFAGLAGLASFVVLHARDHTAKRAWAWSACTVLLLVAASLPILFAFIEMLTQMG